MDLGSKVIVFLSGIPSEAAGPVADTLTPTVMSANAALDTVANEAATTHFLSANIRSPCEESVLDTVKKTPALRLRLAAPKGALFTWGAARWKKKTRCMKKCSELAWFWIAC